MDSPHVVLRLVHIFAFAAHLSMSVIVYDMKQHMPEKNGYVEI